MCTQPGRGRNVCVKAGGWQRPLTSDALLLCWRHRHHHEADPQCAVRARAADTDCLALVEERGWKVFLTTGAAAAWRIEAALALFSRLRNREATSGDETLVCVHVISATVAEGRQTIHLSLFWLEVAQLPCHPALRMDAHFGCLLLSASAAAAAVVTADGSHVDGAAVCFARNCAVASCSRSS